MVLLRAHAIIFPVAFETSDADTILTKTIFGFISSPLAQNILATIIIYLHVIYINRLVITHRLANPITLLPGMIYAIIASFLPEYTMLTPFLFANTFILIAIGQIFRTYKKPQVADIIFNIGFLVGLASLFEPNYIIVLIVGLVSLFVMRSVKLNEILQMILGYVTVYLFFGGVLYLWNIKVMPELMKISVLPKLTIFQYSGRELYTILGIAAIAVFTVLNYGGYVFKKSIQIQKKIDILFWVMMAALLLFFLSKDIDANQVLLLFVPLSILLNFNFIKIKSIMIQEVLHLAIIGLLFAFQFGLL